MGWHKTTLRKMNLEGPDKLSGIIRTSFKDSGKEQTL